MQTHHNYEFMIINELVTSRFLDSLITKQMHIDQIISSDNNGSLSVNLEKFIKISSTQISSALMINHHLFSNTFMPTAKGWWYFHNYACPRNFIPVLSSHLTCLIPDTLFASYSSHVRLIRLHPQLTPSPYPSHPYLSFNERN